MEQRAYNFAAGPSMLADEVLLVLSEERFNYQNSGMAVMEMSHRSAIYLEIFNETKALLKEVMQIPDNYEILFLHGGATAQFSAVPLNLLKGHADYIVTGNFAKKAAEEAAKYGEVRIAFDGKEENYTRIPRSDELQLSNDADYVHLCANNTIFGTEWDYVPDTHGIPLIADMSSNILSKPINVSDYGLIYAGAQKNMGISGLAVVIVRKDLIQEPHPLTPVLYRYDTEVKHDSMYNTPSTYSIYVLQKVLRWIKESGGLAAMQERNAAKAKLLYDCLDASSFYQPVAEKASRSNMNVTFRTKDAEMDAKFAKEAAKEGLLNLKGHRLTGGIRASIYNAMPLSGVEALVDFMKRFERENG